MKIKREGLPTTIAIGMFFLGLSIPVLGFLHSAYVFPLAEVIGPRSATLTEAEANQKVQEIFDGVITNASGASGYSESRWPGENVAYYRFYAPPEEVNKALTKFDFKQTKYQPTLKFAKMNKQPDWWKPSELSKALVYSSGRRWLIYDKNIGLAYLYSSSGEFGIYE